MGWVRREPPLAPGGAVARGEVGVRLADRLLDEGTDGLTGLAGPDLLVVLGEVPWVDGLLWIGRAHADLWTPTARAPRAPSDLVARAVARRVGGTGPWLVVPDGPEGLLAVPLGDAGPIGDAPLVAWRAG